MDIDFTFSTAKNNEDDEITVSLVVNGQIINSGNPPGSFKYTFDDSKTETHNVQIKMSGKKNPDSLIFLNNLQFDRYKIEPIMLQKFAQYSHNFNGNGKDVTDMYTSIMGCNGTIDFTFSTPLYKWLINYA